MLLAFVIYFEETWKFSKNIFGLCQKDQNFSFCLITSKPNFY